MVSSPFFLQCLSEAWFTRSGKSEGPALRSDRNAEFDSLNRYIRRPMHRKMASRYKSTH